MSESSLESSSVVFQISSDATSELDVLPHESYSVGVDGAEVAVFEETSEIALRGLLKSLKTLRGEADVGIGCAGNLSDKSLEGQSWYDSLNLQLESLDFSEGDCSRPEPSASLHDMLPCRQCRSDLAFAAANMSIESDLGGVVLGGAR